MEEDPSSRDPWLDEEEPPKLRHLFVGVVIGVVIGLVYIPIVIVQDTTAWIKRKLGSR